MRPAYSLAWKHFLNFKLVSSVKFAYLSKTSFKQRTYKKRGIDYAKSYKKKIRKLLRKVRSHPQAN